MKKFFKNMGVFCALVTILFFGKKAFASLDLGKFIIRGYTNSYEDSYDRKLDKLDYASFSSQLEFVEKSCYEHDSRAYKFIKCFSEIWKSNMQKITGNPSFLYKKGGCRRSIFDSLTTVFMNEEIKKYYDNRFDLSSLTTLLTKEKMKKSYKNFSTIYIVKEGFGKRFCPTDEYDEFIEKLPKETNIIIFFGETKNKGQYLTLNDESSEYGEHRSPRFVLYKKSEENDTYKYLYVA